MNRIALASSIAGLGLVLTACGGGSEEGSTAANPSPSASVTQEGAASDGLDGEMAAVPDTNAAEDESSSSEPNSDMTVAPEDSFEGEVVDLGMVEVSVGDRIGVPVPNDLIFNGDPATWNFQVQLDPLVQQADLNREDVGDFMFVADPTADESALSYDIVAAGEGAIRISFTNPEGGESTMIVVKITSK